ncbi:MAG: VCBS repeat-containing protein [Alphaproteobacteria bacterium]|nr:VCBS repeat-containing protein [Alphaproteobacteria bacterium]
MNTRIRNRFFARLVALAAGVLLTAALSPRSVAAGYGPEQVLYTFCSQSNCFDGGLPYGGLITDAGGNLYGTTYEGGIGNGFDAYQLGTVFKLTPSGSGWSETVLYNFCSAPGSPCADGGYPVAGLVIDGSGNLYGTTTANAWSAGTVFKLTPSQGGYSYSQLYSFCPGGSPCTDGRDPEAGLVMDANGNLYGTTQYGGNAAACNAGQGFCGVVFRLTPNGAGYTYSVLYNFCSQTNCTDGTQPRAGLILDGNGNLYGTTYQSGNTSNGTGTVFRLSPTGGGGYAYSVLYTFCSQTSCADGANPAAGLIMDGNGNLYGTTSGGGSTPAGGHGTIFMLSPTGGGQFTYSLLYTFCSSGTCADGSSPQAALIRDRDGNLYGTTGGGAPNINAYGTVFKLAPNGSGWTETVLKNFCSNVFTSCAGGGQPLAGLLMDGAGNLFGTTLHGGNAACEGGCGMVFELNPAPVYARQADFNADARGDILWRYIDGTVAVWEMNGASVLASVGGQSVANTWGIAGTGDFNGDGKTDLLWRYVDGTIALWLMDGGNVLSSSGLGTVAAGWRVVGTGDFDGDGTTDILWQYTDGTVVIWFMKGGAVGSVANIGSAASGWEVAGVGDFNGDGKADILWRYTDGTVAMWLMNGATIASDLGVGSAPAGWTLIGTGDFNHDGKTDVLWQYSDGTVAVWLMNGAAVTSSLGIGNAAAGWTVAGTADFNGDGTTDILWRYTDGTVAMWLVSGAAVASSLGAGSADPAWGIVE